jgi:endonuclease/exonuclease/phosphatase family metal-dependent hydrolase
MKSPVWFLLAATLPACAASGTLDVMTFNVRYPAPGDGPNAWEARRDILVSVIRDRQPDVVGTQELFQVQGDYIVSKLPEYAWFGLSRRGNHEDEHMGVFYRKSRLELLDSGNYWLSETPDRPGSMSWGVSLPRMVTWAEFRDRASGRRFRFLNTHFPHRREDEEARKQCARVIVEKLKALPAATTVVLTGDFNTDIASEAHEVLAGTLRDAWKEMQDPTGPMPTFHGFKGTPRGSARIDWILYRGPLAPVRAETITANENGRYPSDHFPVSIRFEWK